MALVSHGALGGKRSDGADESPRRFSFCLEVIGETN